MDLSLVVADELRAILRKNNRTVSPVALTQAVEDLRSELADDAIFEFCLGEIMRQVDAQSTAQEEEQRAERSRFSKFFVYDDEEKPYSGRVPTTFYE